MPHRPSGFHSNTHTTRIAPSVPPITLVATVLRGHDVTAVAASGVRRDAPCTLAIMAVPMSDIRGVYYALPCKRWHAAPRQPVRDSEKVVMSLSCVCTASEPSLPPKHRHSPPPPSSPARCRQLEPAPVPVFPVSDYPRWSRRVGETSLQIVDSPSSCFSTRPAHNGRCTAPLRPSPWCR